MSTIFTPEMIAQVTHEANKTFCTLFGDLDQLPWSRAPDWQRESAVQGVYAIIDNRDMTPEEAHQSWAAAKRIAGWKYGKVKDPEAKTHPCLVPYHELPPEQRAKDYLFTAIVKALIEADLDA